MKIYVWVFVFLLVVALAVTSVRVGAWFIKNKTSKKTTVTPPPAPSPKSKSYFQKLLESLSALDKKFSAKCWGLISATGQGLKNSWALCVRSQKKWNMRTKKSRIVAMVLFVLVTISVLASWMITLVVSSISTVSISFVEYKWIAWVIVGVVAFSILLFVSRKLGQLWKTIIGLTCFALIFFVGLPFYKEHTGKLSHSPQQSGRVAKQNRQILVFKPETNRPTQFIEHRAGVWGAEHPIGQNSRFFVKNAGGQKVHYRVKFIPEDSRYPSIEFEVGVDGEIDWKFEYRMRGIMIKPSVDAVLEIVVLR